MHVLFSRLLMCGVAVMPALLACAPSVPTAGTGSATPAIRNPQSPIPPEGNVAVDIVSVLPDVKAYCASLEKAPQPSHCTMWSEDDRAPTTKCAANASYLDDCLWPVYLGESHPDHAVRFATMWVNLTTRSVVAVSDFACGQMPLATWRAWRAKVAASPGSPPDCPEPPR